MIGFIRKADLPILVIGVIIGIPITVGGMFALLHFFPEASENVAVCVGICLVGISYLSANYIWRAINKRD